MGEMATYILPAFLMVTSAQQAAIHKQLEGTWEVESETWAGWQLPDELRATEVTIKGNIVTQTSKVKSEQAGLRLRLFNSPPFAATPTLDLVDMDQEMGYFAAIYKLDNAKGTLTICYVIRRSLDRPTEFTSTKDNTNCVLVLKRKKAP
jgi:uncharacterized protein (TIGR03067 family)